jgi:trehalose 6-phosphate synthase
MVQANGSLSTVTVHSPQRQVGMPGLRNVWTVERLQRSLETLFDGESIVILANREPFRHERDAGGNIVVRRSAGGLVTALEPLIHACSGVWVAHGAGTADKAVVDWRDGLEVPPADPLYRLRRVWLNEDEERGYYFGFANEGLWPLCHRVHVQPVFRSGDFQMYAEVNARFAEAVCEEVESDSPLVFVQDYHFALAPRYIRECLPQSTIVAFWHIPWPHVRDFQICPWGRQLLEGLLGSSIVGFQTPLDCKNFVETVESSLGAHVNRSRDVITYKGRRTMVRAYPVSIEWPSRWAAESPAIETCRETVRRQLQLPSNVRLGVGVDRLDYTKGINEKFLAVERLLDSSPEFRERFVFVQIAEPSRACLPAYRDLRARVVATADRINRRFGAGSYRPIILLEAHFEPAEVYRFLRAADLCYVGSLHDGMNLVAKEFVACRGDEDGVLILSRFTGASRELRDALLINPYDIGEVADAITLALEMTREERRARMRRMRQSVKDRNVYRWAADLIAELVEVRPEVAAAPSRPEPGPITIPLDQRRVLVERLEEVS